MAFIHGTLRQSVSVAAIAAVVASAVTYLLAGPGNHEHTLPVVADGAGNSQILGKVEALSSRVRALESSAQAVHSQPGRTGLPTAASQEVSELRERLDELESELARLEPALAQTREQALRSFAQEATLASPAVEYTGNARGQESYAEDNGRPLGSHAEAIPDALHALSDAIDLSDVHCKSSVCRISYAERSGNGERLNLADHLSGALGNADLDVHYGRDEAGRKVMYLQVR